MSVHQNCIGVWTGTKRPITKVLLPPPPRSTSGPEDLVKYLSYDVYTTFLG